MKHLTKKQIELFTKLYIGSMLFHDDIDFEDVRGISLSEMELIRESIARKGVKLLGDNPAISGVKEIWEFVCNAR